MPLQTLKTTSPGFLRESHFSTLADSLIKGMFGEAKRPPWMKFTITSQHKAAERLHVFSLCVDIEPHRKVNIGAAGGLSIGSPRRHHSFTVPFEVPDSVIAEFREDLADMFTKWLEAALWANAHRFYEFDPRAGWRWDGSAEELPVSKLFDPPEKFNRCGLQIIVSAANSPVPDLGPCCFFCQRSHTVDDPPAWAGANLMWVHLGCWRRS